LGWETQKPIRLGNTSLTLNGDRCFLFNQQGKLVMPS
jgi:hypothetical protein